MTQQQSDVFAVVYVETHHVAGDERSRTMLNALKIEAKRHNKRKGSEVYHKRVQKKWDKRVLKEGSACKLSVQVPVQVSMAQNFSNLLISLES